MDEIYFDYAATTPVDARVLQAMLPYFTQHFGNPSSIHALGQSAEAAVEGARRDVAEVLHARSEEIIFTGCGTESDNAAWRSHNVRNVGLIIYWCLQSNTRLSYRLPGSYATSMDSSWNISRWMLTDKWKQRRSQRVSAMTPPWCR